MIEFMPRKVREYLDFIEETSKQSTFSNEQLDKCKELYNKAIDSCPFTVGDHALMPGKSATELALYRITYIGIDLEGFTYKFDRVIDTNHQF